MIGFGQISISNKKKKEKNQIIEPLLYDSTSNLFTEHNQAIGQKLYLLPSKSTTAQEYGYSNFILQYNKSTVSQKNIYKCCGEKSIYSSNYNEMQGRYFTVIDAIEDGYYTYYNLKDEEGNLLYWKGDATEEISFSNFIIVGYFEKLKNRLVGSKISRDDYNQIKDSISGKNIYVRHWKCIDINLDEETSSLSLLLEDKEGVKRSLTVKNNRTVKFEDKILEEGMFGFQYNIKDVDPEINCYIEIDPLNCYKNTIKDWSKNLEDINSYQDFNFTKFDFIRYENDLLILEDDKKGLVTLSKSILRKILKRNSYESLLEVESVFYDLFFNEAIESQKKINVFDISSSLPNSAGGVNLQIDFFYYDKEKEIKYIDFTVVPYNSVNDVSLCEIKRRSSAVLRITGPITSRAYPFSYNWETVWYNNTISYVKITKMKITYKDGSSYVYVKELNKVLSPYIYEY